MKQALKYNLPEGVMLNAYPDSCGGNLKEMIRMLQREEFRDVFSCLYILPSMFESDLDRGFSVISYDLNSELVGEENLHDLCRMGLSLKLDFVLNHLSVQSPQFQDLLEKGDQSEYVDTFIDWNKFWKGKGQLTAEGYIMPQDEYLSKLFMRKAGLPILKVPFPDGSYRFYWNSFYQEKTIHGYLGQMDLNAQSQKVWDFYEDTFKKFSRYGASIVRLDAFAYLHKEAGSSNFFNEPGTWEYLSRIKASADKYGMTLLPEIHSKYEDGIHESLAGRGFPIYDFFFPGLVFNTIESSDSSILLQWIREIRMKKYKTVNMLGCHDGIPLLDVKGLLDEKTIGDMIELIKSRGGRVKDLYAADGQKISYYQLNAAFFSALNEDPEKMILARAIQMFMPGMPEVWYLDLFGGTNDYHAADTIGHKDINRTNLSGKDIDSALKTSLVQEQLKLMKFRNSHGAFGWGSHLKIESDSPDQFFLSWHKEGYSASLRVFLKTLDFTIHYSSPDKEIQPL